MASEQDIIKKWLKENFNATAIEEMDAADTLANEKADFLRAEIHPILATLRKNLKNVFEGISHEGRKLLDEDHTSIEEMDATEIKVSELEKLKDDQKARLGRIAMDLSRLSEDMRAKKSKDGTRWFDDKEIAAEIYLPLVRERLLPETLTGDAFSAVQEMLDNTFRLYEDKVQQLKKEGKLTPKTNKAALVCKAVSTLASIGSGAVGATDGITNALNVKLGKDATKVLETFGTVCEIVETSASAIQTPLDSINLSELKPGDTRKLLREITASVAGTIEGTLTKAGVPEAVCARIGQLANLIIKADSFAKAIEAAKEGDYTKLASVFTASTLNARINGLLGDASITIKFEFKSISVSKEASASEIKDQVINAFAATATQVKKKITEADKKKMEQALNTRIEELEKEEAKEELELQMKAEENEIEEIMSGGYYAQERGKERVADLSPIQGLIDKIERDRKIYETAKTIASKGIDFASKMFPPGIYDPTSILKIGMALIDSMKEALTRGIAFNKWVKNQKRLEKAQSVFDSAAQNFIRNQSEQFDHHTAKAIAKAIELVGEALKAAGALVSAAGPAAGAGPVLGAIGSAVAFAGSAADQVEDLRYDIYNAVQLEKAWNQTKDYLGNPENRRKGLLAIRANPTLAKYSIAWGAFEKRDRLAREICAGVGLTPENMRNKDTDAHKIVEYLETLYSEDRQIYREFTGNLAWIPAKAELTMANWGLFCSGFLKNYPKKEIEPSPSLFGEITAKLSELESQSAALGARNPSKLLDVVDFAVFATGTSEQQKEMDAKAKNLAGVNSIYTALHKALESFRTQVHHTQMENIKEAAKAVSSIQNYVARLQFQADEQQKAISKIPDEIARLKEQMSEVEKAAKKEALPKDKAKETAAPSDEPQAETFESIDRADIDLLTKIHWKSVKKSHKLPDTKKANIGGFANKLDTELAPAFKAAADAMEKKDAKLSETALKKLLTILNTVVSDLKIYSTYLDSIKKTNEPVARMMEGANRIITIVNNAQKQLTAPPPPKKPKKSTRARTKPGARKNK